MLEPFQKVLECYYPLKNEQNMSSEETWYKR